MEIFTKLRKEGLGIQVHYIPVYSHPYYHQLGYKQGLAPVAEKFYKKEISISIYPAIEVEDTNYVVKKIFEVFKEI